MKTDTNDVTTQQFNPSDLILAALRTEPLSEAQIAADLPADAQAGIGNALQALCANERIHADVTGRYHLGQKGRREADQVAVHCLLVARGPLTIPEMMGALRAERGTVEYAAGLLVAQKLIGCEYGKSGTVFKVLGSPLQTTQQE